MRRCYLRLCYTRIILSRGVGLGAQPDRFSAIMVKAMCGWFMLLGHLFDYAPLGSDGKCEPGLLPDVQAA